MPNDKPLPNYNPVTFYALLVPLLARAAQAVGYCLALHGSMSRDLDLVAVPWIVSAASPEDLLKALTQAIGWAHERNGAITGPEAKPHGRMAYTIPLSGGAYIDLSIMPRSLG